ncbi:hypothetical protein ACWCQ1_45750 [Streptomyces sp. NPDC002144]
MARELAAKIPDIDIPECLVAEVEPDHDAGVAAACQQVLILRGSGAFDSVPLVPLSRYGRRPCGPVVQRHIMMPLIKPSAERCGLSTPRRPGPPDPRTAGYLRPVRWESW